MKDKKIKLRTLLIILFSILVLTFLSHSASLENSFVNWDDEDYISNNHHIKSLNSENIVWMFTSTGHASNWHPLTWLSHAIDYSLWGLNPGMHHLTNIILHCINTLWIFFFTIVILIIAKRGKVPANNDDNPLLSLYFLVAAAITALFFGIHPIHVESIAWASERKDVLCAFFVLPCYISYLFYASSLKKGQKAAFYALVFLLFLMSLLSKPMAITAPIIFLLLDIFPLNRLKFHGKRITWPALAMIFSEKIPFFILSIVSGLITMNAQANAKVPLNLISLPDRILNGLHSVIFYIKNIALPFKLVPYYPFPQDISIFALRYLISVFIITAITIFCILMLKKKKGFWFVAWSSYLVALAPVIGIIQVGDQAAADRYAYLPTISIFMLAGIGVGQLYKKIFIKRDNPVIKSLFIITLIFICLGMGALSFKQTRVWKNSETLWGYVIKNFPDKVFKAHCNLGIVYSDKGLIDQAVIQYKKSIKLNPGSGKTYNNLGLAYLHSDRVKDAIKAFETALSLSPELISIHNNLGSAYFKEGMIDKAITEWDITLKYNPDIAETHNNLGVSYFQKGMMKRAEDEFKKTINIAPENFGARNSLIIIYLKQGRKKEAVSEYLEIIRQRPDSPELMLKLADLYKDEGQFDDAVKYYKKALKIHPYFAEALNNLGFVYLKKGEYAAAIKQFMKKIEINPEHYDAYYNIACIYSLQNNPEQACSWLKKAINRGLKDFDFIKNDSDLKPIKGSDCYKEIMKGK